ncbi:MAG: ABC transporter permease, partial [Gemmatimonadetes bacterium]|nr:ABC transporter permease [Gemmatimonadota bacterium]
MRPPRWAERLLEVCLPPGLTRDSILGDMLEELESRGADVGEAAAARWYVRHALGLSLRYLPQRLFFSSADPERSMSGLVTVPLVNAVRSLRRAPGFTGMTTLTLALAIGATATVFSVVDGVLLRSLPYPDSDALATISSVHGAQELPLVSEPEYHDMVAQLGSVTAIAAYQGAELAVGSGGEPERLFALRSTASLVEVLAVDPAAGRWFSSDEDTPDGARTIVLSHGLAARLFGTSSGAVGSQMLLDDRPHTVVGVMPAGFAFPAPEMQAWLPLRLDLAEPFGRNNKYLRVVTRVRPETPLGALGSELGALAARI